MCYRDLNAPWLCLIAANALYNLDRPFVDLKMYWLWPHPMYNIYDLPKHTN